VSPLDSNNPQGVVVQKPRSDIYTTLLFLSFIAIVIACLCLWLEMRTYNFDFKASEAQVRSTVLAPSVPAEAKTWRLL
jgi:hypothetical protein